MYLVLHFDRKFAGLANLKRKTHKTQIFFQKLIVQLLYIMHQLSLQTEENLEWEQKLVYQQGNFMQEGLLERIN